MDEEEIKRVVFSALCDNQHPKGKGILVRDFIKIASLIADKLSGQFDAQVSFAEPNLIEAGWIDTKKELPNNDRFVIIYWDNGYYNEMNVASYDALDMQWYDHNRESFTDNVTHWREFPPKP